MNTSPLFYTLKSSGKIGATTELNPQEDKDGHNFEKERFCWSDDDSPKSRNPLVNLFGNREKQPCDQNETELDDLQILSFRGQEQEPGFDVCPEYSFESDKSRTKVYTGSVNSSEDEDEENNVNEEERIQIYVLGKLYNPMDDYAMKREDEMSLFWFTYRCDFPEIKPYRIQSDTGWGCMLRSAQMMLCQVLRMHFKSREWRPPQSLAARRQDPFVRNVMTWFADLPSTTACFYSFHNMVAAGLSYEKLPGEWYGPGTASFVLRDLVAMHENHLRIMGEDSNKSLFRVHVAVQGTVYRDEIQHLMTRDSQNIEGSELRNSLKPVATHPLDQAAWEENPQERVCNWETALLLLIPLRLGLQTFNTDYVRAVAHTFSLPQSVGVLGGRPRGARWFYGAFSDGSKIFGLDPHTVQAAPRHACQRVNGQLAFEIDLSDDYLRSIQTSYAESISLQKMDPSIALGFYCRKEQDLDFVLSSIERWKSANPDLPDLFTTAKYSPNYAVNISMQKIMLSTSSPVDADDEQISDEDEYIML